MLTATAKLVLVWLLSTVVWPVFLLDANPGDSDHSYFTGEEVPLLNSKLGPISDPNVGVHPYSAPLCTPNLTDPAQWAEQYKIFYTRRPMSSASIAKAGGFPSPSVYKIKFNETVTKKPACSVVDMTAQNKQRLKDLIRDEYFYEFFVGGMVVRAFVGTMKNGVWSLGDAFVYTHLEFYFVTSGNTIKKVFATPSGDQCLDCEVNSVVFTYSVEWLPEKFFPSNHSADFSLESKYSTFTFILQYFLNLSFTGMLGIVAGVFLLCGNFWIMLLRYKSRVMSAFRKSSKAEVDEYDIIVHSDWFDTLLSGGESHEIEENNGNAHPRGWKVTFPAIEKLSLSDKSQDIKGTALAMVRRVQQMQGLEQYKADDSSLKTVFVGVLGLYNKGKTFVLNHVGGTSLLEGVSQHTEGISMKTPRKKPFNRFTLVDIAGFDAPIEVKSGDTERTISHRKSIDAFIQDVVLRLCSAFIVVVGDITLKDQQYLDELSYTLHRFKASFASDSRSGEVNPTSRSKLHDSIVVHNFALEKDLRQCQNAFAQQVEQNYKDAGWIEEELGKYYKVREVATKKAGMRHVFIGRSSDPGSPSTEMDRHNSNVFKMIRRWIDSGVSNDTAVEPLQEIVSCCNAVFPRFVLQPPPPLILVNVQPADAEQKKETEMLICFEKNKYLKMRSLEGGLVNHEKEEDSDKTLFVKTDFALSGLNAPPKSPPYDIVVAKDAVEIYLDSASVEVTATYDPDTKKCQVKGEIPRPDVYGEEYNFLAYQQRFTGPFDFSIDVGRVREAPTFNKAELMEGKNGNKNVIRLEILKPITMT